jgi:hypothetical protein
VLSVLSSSWHGTYKTIFLFTLNHFLLPLFANSMLIIMTLMPWNGFSLVWQCCSSFFGGTLSKTWTKYTGMLETWLTVIKDFVESSPCLKHYYLCYNVFSLDLSCTHLDRNSLRSWICIRSRAAVRFPFHPPIIMMPSFLAADKEVSCVAQHCFPFQ